MSGLDAKSVVFVTKASSTTSKVFRNTTLDGPEMNSLAIFKRKRKRGREYSTLFNFHLSESVVSFSIIFSLYNYHNNTSVCYNLIVYLRKDCYNFSLNRCIPRKNGRYTDHAREVYCPFFGVIPPSTEKLLKL